MEEMKQQMKEMMDSVVDELGKGELTEYKGRIFAPGFSVECAEHLKNWDIPENSVIISSFPKTGTVWCKQIVRQILGSNDENLLERSESIPMPMLFLDIGPKMKFDLFPQVPLPRKYFSTHFAEEFFNFDKIRKSKTKVIYVMRNPKDQAVSWFHFSKKIPFEDSTRKMLGEDWNQFYTSYLNGEHPMGLKKGELYPDHVLGWLKHKDDDNFLIVMYEDLKKDIIGGIRRMADFLEADLSNDDVHKIADKCSIGSMKKSAARDQSGFLKMNVRKGEVGGWKDQLTVSQSEQMDRLIEEKLGNSGIKFTYAL